MEDLKQLRDRIDEIDGNFVKLFEERMETVLQIAEYKKRNNIPILDEDREKLVIQKNKSRLKDRRFEDSLESFFRNLMKLSKDEQEKIV